MQDKIHFYADHVVRTNSTVMGPLNFNRLWISDFLAQLEVRLLREQKVPGSNTTVSKTFHFAIFACFAFVTTRVSPWKLNQLSQYPDLDQVSIEKKIWRQFSLYITFHVSFNFKQQSVMFRCLFFCHSVDKYISDDRFIIYFVSRTQYLKCPILNLLASRK